MDCGQSTFVSSYVSGLEPDNIEQSRWRWRKVSLRQDPLVRSAFLSLQNDVFLVKERFSNTPNFYTLKMLKLRPTIIKINIWKIWIFFFLIHELQAKKPTKKGQTGNTGACHQFTYDSSLQLTFRASRLEIPVLWKVGSHFVPPNSYSQEEIHVSEADLSCVEGLYRRQLVNPTEPDPRSGHSSLCPFSLFLIEQLLSGIPLYLRHFITQDSGKSMSCRNSWMTRYDAIKFKTSN